MYIVCTTRGCPASNWQELIELPADLTSINFHSTKIGQFDGQPRLFLPANGDAMVAVVSLEGEVDFILPRPEFDEYSDESTPFNPTDTVQHGNRLLVADGYGANYVSTADLATRKWISLFGGKTDSLDEHGKFGTAHGFNPTPTGGQLFLICQSWNPGYYFVLEHLA